MQLVEMLFSVARNISDGDLNELNKLQERAKNETTQYHTEQKGFKGLYAKINQQWYVQLAFVFIAPFLTAYLIGVKNRFMTQSTNPHEDLEEYDDFEDSEEAEEYERLKRKYANL
jgi:hypothetical protein